MSRPFLREIIENQAASRAAQNFLTFGESRYTYSEIDQHSNRVANALSRLGLKSNQRIAFFLPNSPDFIFGWFATIKLNLTLVPINTQLKGEALRYILSHAEPQAVMVAAQLLPELLAVSQVLPHGCKIIVLGSTSPLPTATTGVEFYTYEDLFAQSSPERPPEIAIAEDDTGLIIYTSGTTGYPKGVMLSRRAQTNHPLFYHPELLQTTPDETAYTYLPLFHVTSMGVTMGSFVGGAQLALDTEFSAFGFWERIRRYNATVFPYLGAVLSMLYARPPREDDTQNPARWALGGAAPKEIWAGFEKRFGVRILETYGQSEWGCIWVKHELYRGQGESRIGAAGKAPPRAQVKIIDDSGSELPPHTPGQLIMRPAETGLMMTGYYRQPELNAKVFQEGWFYTGDVGELDAEGYLYFRGRIKDYIRRRGENISAHEIERVVDSHPAVAESAAVGVPSKLGEEEVKLCVVLKAGQALTSLELWQFCKQHLPAFMVPQYIDIREALPRTATQRVRKFMLAEEGIHGVWSRKASRRSQPEPAEPTNQIES